MQLFVAPYLKLIYTLIFDHNKHFKIKFNLPEGLQPGPQQVLDG
jgi:hypothetical protein